MFKIKNQSRFSFVDYTLNTSTQTSSIDPIN